MMSIIMSGGKGKCFFPLILMLKWLVLSLKLSPQFSIEYIGFLDVMFLQKARLKQYPKIK